MMRILTLLVAMLMIGLTSAPTVAAQDPVSATRDLALAILEEAQKPGGGELSNPNWWLDRVEEYDLGLGGILCISGTPWITLAEYDPQRTVNNALGLNSIDVLARVGGYTDGAPNEPSIKFLQVSYGGCDDGQEADRAEPDSDGGVWISINGDPSNPVSGGGDWGWWAIH